MAAPKYTLVALVEDKPGVLNRVASLFRRRGFNIQSLAVGPTEQPGLSRMTIVVGEVGAQVEQVRKQLEKLVDVVKVYDISGDSLVARELALIRVRATPQNRAEIIQIVDVFRAFVERHALRLGLSGYVRNLRDGRVEVWVEGEKARLEELLGYLHRGPAGARVEGVEVEWGGTKGAFRGFEVRY